MRGPGCSGWGRRHGGSIRWCFAALVLNVYPTYACTCVRLCADRGNPSCTHKERIHINCSGRGRRRAHPEGAWSFVPATPCPESPSSDGPTWPHTGRRRCWQTPVPDGLASYWRFECAGAGVAIRTCCAAALLAPRAAAVCAGGAYVDGTALGDHRLDWAGAAATGPWANGCGTGCSNDALALAVCWDGSALGSTGGPEHHRPPRPPEGADALLAASNPLPHSGSRRAGERTLGLAHCRGSSRQTNPPISSYGAVPYPLRAGELDNLTPPMKAAISLNPPPAKPTNAKVHTVRAAPGPKKRKGHKTDVAEALSLTTAGLASRRPLASSASRTPEAPNPNRKSQRRMSINLLPFASPRQHAPRAHLPTGAIATGGPKMNRNPPHTRPPQTTYTTPEPPNTELGEHRTHACTHIHTRTHIARKGSNAQRPPPHNRGQTQTPPAANPNKKGAKPKPRASRPRTERQAEVPQRCVRERIIKQKGRDVGDLLSQAA